MLLEQGGSDGSRILLEVGPGHTLSQLTRQHPARGPGHLVLPGLPSGEETEDRIALLESLGRLWCAGAAVDWPALHGETRRRRVSLPTYPFDRKRFWINGNSRGHSGIENPFPDASVSAPTASDDTQGSVSEVEKTIHMQLRIMSEQLESINRSRRKA
jgi:acyl transferase domain-containing protein